MSDVSEFYCLPQILARLADVAPGLRIRSVQLDAQTVAASLRSGQIDMALGHLPDLPADEFVRRAREHFARLGQENAAAKLALAADSNFFRAVMLLCQPKLKGVEELPAYAGYFFTEDFAVDPKVREKLFAKGDPKARLRELEANLIGWALRVSHGNKSKAAELLQVKRSTLGDRIRHCGLDRPVHSAAHP